MRHLLIFIVFVSLIQAQQTLYESAYEKAMLDSVVTADEQALLDLLGSPKDSLETARPAMVLNQIQSEILNQDGRWRLIYSTMAVGNGLYGVGLPYILGSENPSHYLGFQFVAAAAGFYLSYNETKSMDLPLGRTAFIERGAALGFSSFFPLHALIGVENWATFDTQGKAMVSYLMLGVPVGAYFGNKLYDRWLPTDGQAMMINNGASLGLLNGLALFRLIYDDVELESEQEFNTAYRVASLLAYGGSVSGLVFSHKYIGNRNYSMGDAFFVQGAAVLGLYTTIQVSRIADVQSTRANILLGMIGVNGFVSYGEKLVRDFDLTQGDALIIGLGTVAANGIWRGLSIMTDLEISSRGAAVVDVVTSLAGFYTTFNSVRARRVQDGSPPNTDEGIGLKLLPTLIWDNGNTVPGIRLEIKY